MAAKRKRETRLTRGRLALYHALLLGAVVVLFIKALYADMMQTRLERQLRRLNQRVAMLELGNVRPGPEAGASAVPGDDNNRLHQADPMR